LPATIVWTETGGPRVAASTNPAGYGSKLIQRSVTRHLRGSIAYDWLEAGLVVTLRVDPTRLAA
jgi:two-component sensor histidine kinase